MIDNHNINFTVQKLRLFEVQEAVEMESLLFCLKGKKRKERRDTHDIYTVCDSIYIGLSRVSVFFYSYLELFNICVLLLSILAFRLLLRGLI